MAILSVLRQVLHLHQNGPASTQITTVKFNLCSQPILLSILQEIAERTLVTGAQRAGGALAPWPASGTKQLLLSQTS